MKTDLRESTNPLPGEDLSKESTIPTDVQIAFVLRHGAVDRKMVVNLSYLSYLSSDWLNSLLNCSIVPRAKESNAREHSFR